MNTKAVCYISETFDPYLNLAIEEWIFNDLTPTEQVLFLWRNEKTVVIGRNQNPWAECNLGNMAEANINLVRRQSGGGAVFHDLGNTNFTFLSPKKKYDKKRNFEIILRALKSLGINAEFAGRNDIHVNSQKVSGSAFKEKVDRAFHHGTLLINANLGELAKYLTPHPKKMLAKGTTSVRSRVTNLVEYNNLISHETLTEKIIEEFFKEYGAKPSIKILNTDSLKKIPEIESYATMLKSDTWRLGETPEFTHHLNERFDWAMLDLHLNVIGGKIADVKIFSDCLDTELIWEIEKRLKDADYKIKDISSRISYISVLLPNASEQIKDILNWLSKEIK